MQSYIQELISSEKLPPSFEQSVERWYQPLAKAIVDNTEQRPLVIGVQGTQGSGKSTFAAFLKAILEHEHKLRTVSLSLDDFYLTREERAKLAEQVHPLFAVRGVPGTHDVELAINSIEALKSAGADQTVCIPRFNKAIDDRYARGDWDEVSGGTDVIIFEGWCVGCSAQASAELKDPINSLEQSEDRDGHWRGYVNKALQAQYQELFALIDTLVVIQAPSFECVLNWRLLQERKLREAWQAQGQPEDNHIQSDKAVERFIAHYERLTRHCLDTLPQQADWLMPISAEHTILDLIQNR